MNKRNRKQSFISTLITIVVIPLAAFGLLSMLGVTGLSAAGITSALAVIGSLTGGGMVVGIIILMLFAIGVKTVIGMIVNRYVAVRDEKTTTLESH